MISRKKFQLSSFVKLAIPMLLFSFSFQSCNSKLEKALNANTVILEDGMYLVKRLGDKSSEILPLEANEKIIEWNEDFIDHEDPDPKYMVIDASSFSPFLLRVKPKTELQEGKTDGRKKLLLEFNEEGKEKLAEYTGQHVNQMTSIVIKGQALTKHVIREAITGGFLQITRCNDNACEMLDIELRDNVVGN